MTAISLYMGRRVVAPWYAASPRGWAGSWPGLVVISCHGDRRVQPDTRRAVVQELDAGLLERADNIGQSARVRRAQAKLEICEGLSCDVGLGAKLSLGPSEHSAGSAALCRCYSHLELPCARGVDLLSEQDYTSGAR